MKIKKWRKQMRIKNKKSKQILLTICIAVVILISVGLFFVSRYLVNYAIGRSGDGGDRQVSLDVEVMLAYK